MNRSWQLALIGSALSLLVSCQIVVLANVAGRLETGRDGGVKQCALTRSPCANLKPSVVEDDDAPARKRALRDSGKQATRPETRPTPACSEPTATVAVLSKPSPDFRPARLILGSMAPRLSHT